MRAETGRNARAYILAFLLCLVAATVARPLTAPSSCFLLAVVATSLFGGRGPAYFTIFVSTCTFEFFFLSPAFHLMHSKASMLRLLVFVGTMVVTEALLHAKRRSDLARLVIAEEFRSLAETSPDGILFVDGSGTLLFSNPAVGKMFGISGDNLPGHNVSELLPEFHERQSSGEFIAVRADGTSFHVEATCGRFGSRTTIFLRDVSDRKAAEQQLKRSEESLRLTLETIPGLVYTCAPGGGIEYANDQVSQYLGKTLPEVQAQGWDEAIHPEERKRVIQEREASVSAGLAHTTEYRLRRFDGIYRWHQTSVRPLTDRGDFVLRWYGVLTDIDERRHMEDSLRRTQAQLAKASQTAAVSELAAAVVHEISQPLSAIVANAQACVRWLASAPPNTADGKASAERIVRDGKDAAEIIRGLRSLFRYSQPEMTRLDLPSVIAEVASLLRGRAQREEISLRVEVSPGLATVMGDKIQLQQVLMNLAVNAMEALHDLTSQPRHVMIRTRQEGSVIVTEVADNGRSTPDFASIFDPFVTTKPQGMGMGLSICRSIINAHHGRLWGAARPEGGTVFTFTLPVQDDHDEP